VEIINKGGRKPLGKKAMKKISFTVSQEALKVLKEIKPGHRSEFICKCILSRPPTNKR